MWKKKEVMTIIFTCLISCGTLAYGAITDIINGQPIILPVIAVILSAMMLSIALYIFDDYVAQLEDK